MLTVGAARTVASRTLRPALTVGADGTVAGQRPRPARGVEAIGTTKPAMFTRRANAIASSIVRGVAWCDRQGQGKKFDEAEHLLPAHYWDL